MPFLAPARSPELFLLCGGGGRAVADRQLLPTAGFIYRSPSFRLYCDPGPGALVKSIQRGVDLQSIDAVFVSHGHLDHANDANAIIEAMTFRRRPPWDVRRGYVVASESVLHGLSTPDHEFEPLVHKHFVGLTERAVALKAGQTFSCPRHNVSITGTKTVHEDTSGIGFILKHQGVKIGYTGDTEPFPELASTFDGCGTWVVNCLKPDAERFEFHLNTDDVIAALRAMERPPRPVVLSHAGHRMLVAGRQRQAEKVQRAVPGVRAIVAAEGVRVRL